MEWRLSIESLETDNKELKQSDNRLWTTVQNMQSVLEKQNKDTNKQLVETKTRVDSIDKGVTDLRVEVAENNGVIKNALANNSSQQDKLIDLIKHGQETAAGIQKTEITTTGDVQKTTVTTNNDKNKVIIPAVVGSMVGLVVASLPFIQRLLENIFK